MRLGCFRAVTNEYKDSEGGECLRLVKRPTKCHGQGEKWRGMKAKSYAEPKKQDLTGCSKDLGFYSECWKTTAGFPGAG